MRNRIAPTQVVVPSLHADVAEDGAAVAASDFGRPVDIVDNFVVVKGKERRDVAVPVGQIRTFVVVMFVVLPDADDGRCDLDDARLTVLKNTYLLQPAVGRIVALLLIEPVAVEDGEIDAALLLIALEVTQHCGVRRQGTAEIAAAAGSLIVAAREFEAEVEQAFRVVVGTRNVIGRRQRMERAARASLPRIRQV